MINTAQGFRLKISRGLAINGFISCLKSASFPKLEFT